MVHELTAAMDLVGAKFEGINRCLRWAVGSFVLWIGLILMTNAA